MFQSAGETVPKLEIEAAIYDKDGHFLNSTANRVNEDTVEAIGKATTKDAYRMSNGWMRLWVPNFFG